MKLRRVECLGGPLDGRWVTVRDDLGEFLVNTIPLVLHLYVMDEQQTGKGVRTVYRHSEVSSPEIKRKQ
jgi:hypothetical protein